MDSESIANFCSITDATDTTAEYFLNAAGGDLDIAIGLFYESGGTGENITSTTTSSSNNNDNRYNSASRTIHEISADFSARPTAQNTLNSREPAEVVVLSDSSSSDAEGIVLMNRRDENSGNEGEDVIFRSGITSRRLADLFRPPYGIMFNGGLEMARRQARDLNRWLLLTIHAPTDFASQAMNRDLWNSSLVQSFIKENFVFMQLVVGGSEERRYSNFYPFDGLYPHVALIDPRTGERVETLLISSIPVPGFKLVPSDRDLIEILGEFLAENSLDPLNGNRKRSTSSPKLEEFDEEPTKKTMTTTNPNTNSTTNPNTNSTVDINNNASNTSSPSDIPNIPDQFNGSNAIQVQFRLPNGQKHRHLYNPQTVTLPEIFQTASAVSQIPLGQFKLATAEMELDGETGKFEGFEMKKLHNNMITIIK